MSMRSAARLARSVRSAAPLVHRAPVVARRAASSGGHKAPGSDLPWAIGSAAVFLPLTAYVLTKRGDGHGADHSKDHPAENQYANTKQVDQHGRTGLATQIQEPEEEKSEGKAEGNKGGAPNAENAPGVNKEKQAIEQAEKIDSPKEATAVQEHGGEVNKAAAEIAGGNQAEVEGKSETKGDKEEKKSDESESSGDEPSPEEIKASLAQAERSNVPRAAMAEEVKGNDTQAGKDE